jgi:hypothetical protein
MNIVIQCGMADNIMCQINQTSKYFLLDQFKQSLEAVIAIKQIQSAPGRHQAKQWVVRA